MGSGGGRTWLTAVATGFLALAVLAAPALSQQQPGPSEKPDGKGARKASKARPIDLVVDSATKLTWSPQDLERLASASEVKWSFGKKRLHPIIPIWDLLKDGGVPKDTVKEIRITAGSKAVTVKGEDLAKVDQLVLTNAGKGPIFPWRLTPLDPSLEERTGAFSLRGVRRLEVITGQ